METLFFIPKRLETVSIFGEVLNPTTILHSEKVTYKEYLEYAGGMKQFALKGIFVYVIRADGLVTKRPKFLFLEEA